MNYIEEGRIRFIKPSNATHWRQYHAWQIWINQNWRDTDIVACKKGKFLFCYWMPNGKHYYAEVYLTKHGTFGPVYRSINRKFPPALWKLEIEIMEDSL